MKSPIIFRTLLKVCQLGFSIKLLPALVLVPGVSLAQNPSTKRCLTTEKIEIESWTSQVGPCYFVKPQLKTTYQVYDKSNESLPVNYWEGGYARQLTLQTTYHVFVVNRCGKKNGRVEHSYWTTEPSKRPYLFDFLNPNLNRDIEYSFLKSPLTEEEVANELPVLKQKCEATTDFY
jgi:hypothetical protein